MSREFEMVTREEEQIALHDTALRKANTQLAKYEAVVAAAKTWRESYDDDGNVIIGRDMVGEASGALWNALAALEGAGR